MKTLVYGPLKKEENLPTNRYKGNFKISNSKATHPSPLRILIMNFLVVFSVWASCVFSASAIERVWTLNWAGE
jgi:hypothetical protein